MSSMYEESMKTKPFLPFHILHLTEEMAETARKELKETEETRAMRLAELKELILAEKKLHGCMDDTFLLLFLRARKFDVKRAFKLYINLYEVKKAYPECYDDCDEEQLRSLLRSGASTMLPYRDADGCVVIIIHMKNWNPDDYNIAIVLRGLTLLILFALEDVATQVCGMKIMFDCAGTNLLQVRSINPRYLRLLTKAMRNSIPVRFKSVHVFNENAFFSYLWSVCKLFLADKIRQRVHFHGDKVKHLHKFIAKDILTKEYGGDNLHFNNADFWAAELKTYCEKFIALTQTGYKD